jgi:hypothetical protein
MTADRFDDLTRRLAQSRSRRGVLKGMAGFALAGVAAAFGKLGAAADGRVAGPGGHHKPSPPPRACESSAECLCGACQRGQCVSHCTSCELCFGGDTCYPRCPLACHVCDAESGTCRDTCPQGQVCNRLAGEAGGCIDKCPQQCEEYDPATDSCRSLCDDCAVCKQNTCQSACPDPRQICDNGVCRECNGPCEYLDNGVCIGCDTECETCNQDSGTCETTCSGGRACCLGACIDCCGLCDRTKGLCTSMDGDTLCVGQRDTCCGGLCKDLKDDQQNCGACGNICRGVDGERCCDGVCANLQTDPNNCGACGHVCSAGGICCDGECHAGCPEGQTRCGCDNDSCADIQTDTNNCGACGHVCPSGDDCCDGVCKPSYSGCAVNQTVCGDACCDADFNCIDGSCCPGSQTCGAPQSSGGEICYDRPSQTEECCTYTGPGYSVAYICAGSEDEPPSNCCGMVVGGQLSEGCCPAGYVCASCDGVQCCPLSGPGDHCSACIAPVAPLRT